jgi:hypothetical protein
MIATSMDVSDCDCHSAATLDYSLVQTVDNRRNGISRLRDKPIARDHQ